MVKVKEDMIDWIMSEHGVPDSRLTVIKRVDDYVRKNGQRTARYLCVCNCGENNEVIVRVDMLKSGKIKSCGCLNIESAKITCSINGKKNQKQNKYNLDGIYGIGWTSNTNEEFYFDIEDYDKIKNYYWYAKENEHQYLRLITKSKTDDNFESNEISMAELLGFKEYDHADRNPLNNRKYNFRLATKSQQCMNRNKFKNNTSGIIGVGWRNREQKWCSYIQIDGKTKSLGYYNHKDDAIQARLNAEAKYYGEFAPQKHLFEQYKINLKDGDLM